MPSLLTDVLTAVVVFAATNLDDVFLLLAFFADRRYRASHVLAGQYAGIGLLFAVSAIASLVSLALQPRWLGLLGLIPLALGIKALFEVNNDSDAAGDLPPAGRGSTIVAVTAITIANGGDNFGVYTPLFATLSGPRIAVFAVVFAVMIAIWCDLARRLVTHPSWGPPLHRLSARLLPAVLVGLGVWILIEMDSFSLLYRP